MGRTPLARAGRAAAVESLSFVVAACEAAGAGPPCAAPEAYPACTSARTGVLACEGGEEVVVPCEADEEACLDLVDEASGARLSQCLPVDSVGCAPAAFLPTCADREWVVACVAPATYPAVGHSERVPCGEGESCRLDGDRGACQAEPDPEACDPATFAAACRDATTPLACVDGRVVAREPCTPPTVCLVGPQVAVCAPEPTCDPLRYVPRWVTEETVAVCSPLGQEVTETCGGGRTCQTGPNGGFCVRGAPCDETFRPSCSGRSLIVCNAITGFTDSQPCELGMRCVNDQSQGPVCVPWDNTP